MVNMREREPLGTQVEGVLLYPSTDAIGFDLEWQISSMPLRVRSVNLAADWDALKVSLLGLCNPGVAPSLDRQNSGCL